MTEETTIAASVQELVQQLNKALSKAADDRLKIDIEVDGTSNTYHQRIKVRLWREIEQVDTKLRGSQGD